MNKVWEKALRSIRAQVTAENYSTYFRPLEFQGIEDGRCILNVNDAFFGDWIIAHYTDLLTKEVSLALGQSVTIEVQTIKTQPKRRPKRLNPNVIEKQQANVLVDAFPTNEDYHFDRFVVGPSNELAYAAFQAAARRPAALYNPLFLYGPTE